MACKAACRRTELNLLLGKTCARGGQTCVLVAVILFTYTNIYKYKTSIASSSERKQLIVSCVTCPWIHGCVGVYVGTGGGGVVPYVGISPYVGIFSSAANNPRFIFLPAAPAHAHEYKVILMASVYIGSARESREKMAFTYHGHRRFQQQTMRLGGERRSTAPPTGLCCCLP